MKVVPVLVAALAVACGTAAPVPEVELDPVVVTRPAPTPLDPVAFLAGCWQGVSLDGSTGIDERWTRPSENVMLGTTQYLRDGATVGFEFGHLEATVTGVVYTPYPGGKRSEHGFRLTSTAPGEAVFEAPEHDYPKRITYRRTVEGGLEVTIDAGPEDPTPRGWALSRASCEGLPGR